MCIESSWQWREQNSVVPSCNTKNEDNLTLNKTSRRPISSCSWYNYLRSTYRIIGKFHGLKFLRLSKFLFKHNILWFNLWGFALGSQLFSIIMLTIIMSHVSIMLQQLAIYSTFSVHLSSLFRSKYLIYDQWLKNDLNKFALWHDKHQMLCLISANFIVGNFSLKWLLIMSHSIYRFRYLLSDLLSLSRGHWDRQWLPIANMYANISLCPFNFNVLPDTKLFLPINTEVCQEKCH